MRIDFPGRRRGGQRGAQFWRRAIAGAVFLLGVGMLAPGEVRGEEALPAMEAAEDHYRMAVQLYGQGRYREAVEEFDRALELHDDPLVQCNRAVPLLKLGELREARESLLKCRDSYPEESEDYRYIDAQTEALRIIVEEVRPRSIEVAQDIALGPAVVAAPEVVELSEQPRLGGLGGSGIVLLAVGLGAGAAAWAVDLGSGELVEAYREESRGGEGSSEERHRELREELADRQRIFYGLTAASAGFGMIGAGLLGVDLFRVQRERASMELDVGAGSVGVLVKW